MRRLSECEKGYRKWLSDPLKTVLTKGQRKLKNRHGTPAEFASACYACVPGAISMDEAQEAISKYNQEWNEA